MPESWELPGKENRVVAVFTFLLYARIVSVMADIKVNPDRKFYAWVKALPSVAIDSAEKAFSKVGLELLSRIPPYPAKPAKGVVVSRMTARQRGWWFAVGAKGYKGRTANLGRMITFKTTKTKDAVEGHLGTPQKSAPWVIGKAFPGEIIGGEQMWQANVMSHWWRFDKVVDSAIPAAQETFRREFQQAFQEATK